MKLTYLATAVVALLGPSAAAAPAPHPSTASKAVTPEVIDAIAEELGRASASLSIPGAPRPYFIAYKITEVDVQDVHASLGHITASKHRHFVELQARVHVGSYRIDNTNFIVEGAQNIDGMAQVQLPLQATPRIARRAAWLATDQAYKEALAQLLAKSQARRTGTGNVGVASYTRAKPVVRDKPVLVPRLESRKSMEQRARAVSTVLRSDRHLRESRVGFTSFLERRWYLNTEGTSAHDTRRVSGVIIVTTGQAKDGQELALYHSRYGMTGADLPADKALITAARGLSKQMRALQKAPVMANYTGPVLFIGGGAADMVRTSLAPHLGGTPLPEGMSQDDRKLFGSTINDRLGLRVVSPLLSLTDDPTQSRANGRRLIGGYVFDDEGSPAQRTTVIERGKLRTLLTSRTPSKQLAASNGHARRGIRGVFHGSTTNLLVSGTKGVSRAALEAKLLAEAKSQGLRFAVVIERLDDAAMTAEPELGRRGLVTLYNRTDSSSPPPATIAYRVGVNGKRQLVRGVQLRPVPLRAWRDVMAVGNKKTVVNYLASGQPYIRHKIETVGSGFVPSAGVESAVVTPDLLFKELDIVGSTAGRRPMPLVPRPGT